MEGGKIPFHGSLLSSEPWWCSQLVPRWMVVDDAWLLNRRKAARCRTSHATFELIPVDLESIRIGSLYHAGKLQTIQINSRPHIYLCRIQGMIYRIPTLIQRNLIQITNGWIIGLHQIIGTQRVGSLRPQGCTTRSSVIVVSTRSGVIVVNPRGLIHVPVTHVL